MHYLDHSQFITKFNELWNGCKIELFKLEILPEYDEFGIEDWSQVDLIKTQSLIAKVQNEIYASKEEYAKKLAQGINVLRIRYVPYPLTKYILIEFSSYATSQSIGAKIEILEDTGLAKLSPYLKPYFCDFLLFDNAALLKMDNPNGKTKCSAYFSDDKEELAPYINLKNELMRLSQPFNKFMSMMNLQFINTLPDGSQ